MNRQQRRAFERKHRQQIRELQALERYCDGRARGKDFELTAKFMQRSGCLPDSIQNIPASEIGRVLQLLDRQISEGLIKIDLEVNRG